METTMPDDTTGEERGATSLSNGAPQRKPYVAPTLTLLGSLAELTKGGDQEQRGEGPGFSL
jgi:hypothetical protein